MDRQTWDSRYATTELLWTAQPNRWLVEEVAGLPAGRALDLGAGEGRNAVWLAAGGWTVTAVDFSAVGLGKARALAAGRPPQVAGRITWVEADLRDYEPDPGSYDLVLIAYLHLPAADRRAVLPRAAGALALGGILLVIGHDSTNLTRGVGGPRDPAVLFSPGDVLADLAAAPGAAAPGATPAGLSVECAERVRRPVDTGEGSRDAIDALVRLRRAR